jgi:hypothetical protein
MCRIYRSRFLRECLGQGVKLKERGHEIIRREALSRPCGTQDECQPRGTVLASIEGYRREPPDDAIRSDQQHRS